MIHGNKGFSLVELVIALMMLAVLAGIAAPYLSNSAIAYNTTSSALDTVGKLRLASERLAREIRLIRRDILSGGYDIVTPWSATTLSFFKLDGEQVSVGQAGSLLTLGYASVGGTPPLTDEVSNFSLNYWQQDGVTPATGNNNLAIIEFELVLNHAGNSYSQRSRIALRN